MNLYLISQEVNNGYDTYDQAVVCAESAEKAVLISPDGNEIDNGYYTWCAVEDVNVECIGKAVDGMKAGVICASFNAG